MVFATDPFVDSVGPKSARMAGGRSFDGAADSVDCDWVLSVIGRVLVLAASAVVPNDGKGEKRKYE